MKRFLLSTVAAIALVGPAYAQGIPVYDNASILQNAVKFGKEAGWWVQQGMQMKQQVDTATSMLNSVTGPRPLDGIASVMTRFGVQIPGVGNGEVLSAARGEISWGQAPGLAQRAVAYMPQGTDPEAQEMERRRTSYANTMADAQAAADAAEGRLVALQALRARNGMTTDLKEAAALNGEIGIAQAALANEQARAQRMAALQVAQRDVNDMRDREASRKSSQDWYDRTKAVWSTKWF